ncbi:hypothetical protein [Sphingomonas montanisoli]|uniref:Uncharacterized protein n=1 Tax=Sphingomonas montanisoli TaxID=2606412 RepID=A0A5D9C8U5_9SPHN|nr:hypothetical protein [Sphingomonas montanisoli]TZG27727.1 hypothetical protein FYJ91_09165 [Sphingomonas montanisoli]
MHASVPTALMMALALGACSRPASTNEARGDNLAQAEDGNIAANEAEPTIGGDGSDIVLSSLTPAEVGSAKLQGELGCSFTATGGDILLIAKGNVGSKDPAFGIVKVGDYVEQVATPGGYDAMINGATFGGKGKTIRIALTGPAIGSGESPPRPASLTYDRTDGAQRSFAGQWTCGP